MFLTKGVSVDLWVGQYWASSTRKYINVRFWIRPKMQKTHFSHKSQGCRSWKIESEISHSLAKVPSLQYSEKETWRNLVSLLVEFQYFQLSVPYLPPQTQPFRQRKWTQRVFQNFSIWSSNQSHSWNFIKSTQTLLNYLESFLISPEIDIWMIGEERIILEGKPEKAGKSAVVGHISAKWGH